HIYRADRDESNLRAPTGRGKAMVKPGGEVILAAGSFNTPQLLLLSGVGPADKIADPNDQVMDLPAVGTNLQDRREVSIVSEFKATQTHVIGANEPGIDDDFTLIQGCNFGADRDPNERCLSDWLAGVDPKNTTKLENTPAKGVYTSNGAVAGVIRKSPFALTP